MTALAEAGWVFFVLNLLAPGPPVRSAPVLDRFACEMTAEMTSRQNPALIVPRVSDGGRLACVLAPPAPSAPCPPPSATP